METPFDDASPEHMNALKKAVIKTVSLVRAYLKNNRPRSDRDDLVFMSEVMEPIALLVGPGRPGDNDAQFEYFARETSRVTPQADPPDSWVRIYEERMMRPFNRCATCDARISIDDARPMTCSCLKSRYCGLKCQENHWEAGHSKNHVTKKMPKTFLDAKGRLNRYAINKGIDTWDKPRPGNLRFTNAMEKIGSPRPNRVVLTPGVHMTFPQNFKGEITGQRIAIVTIPVKITSSYQVVTGTRFADVVTFINNSVAMFDVLGCVFDDDVYIIMGDPKAEITFSICRFNARLFILAGNVRIKNCKFTSKYNTPPIVLKTPRAKLIMTSTSMVYPYIGVYQPYDISAVVGSGVQTRLTPITPPSPQLEAQMLKDRSVRLAELHMALAAPPEEVQHTYKDVKNFEAMTDAERSTLLPLVKEAIEIARRETVGKRNMLDFEAFLTKVLDPIQDVLSGNSGQFEHFMVTTVDMYQTAVKIPFDSRETRFKLYAKAMMDPFRTCTTCSKSIKMNGRSRTCTCLNTRYCGLNCQRAHWETHAINHVAKKNQRTYYDADGKLNEYVTKRGIVDRGGLKPGFHQSVPTTGTVRGHHVVMVTSRLQINASVAYDGIRFGDAVAVITDNTQCTVTFTNCVFDDPFFVRMLHPMAILTFSNCMFNHRLDIIYGRSVFIKSCKFTFNAFTPILLSTLNSTVTFDCSGPKTTMTSPFIACCPGLAHSAVMFSGAPLDVFLTYDLSIPPQIKEYMTTVDSKRKQKLSAAVAASADLPEQRTGRLVRRRVNDAVSAFAVANRNNPPVSLAHLGGL